MSLITYNPLKVHFDEREVVAFLITDTIEGNSARGDFAGQMEGIVQPVLEWKIVLEGDKYLNKAN